MYKILLLIIVLSSFFIQAEYKWYNEHWHDNEHFYNDDCIDCLDSSNCVAVADDAGFAVVYLTTNGGYKWEKVLDERQSYNDLVGADFPKPRSPQAIQWTSKDSIFLSYDYTSIKITTDRFKSFSDTVQLIDIGELAWLKDLHMYNSNHGITAYHQYVWVTHDGWKTWDTVNNPGAKRPYHASNVWMHNKNYYCYKWWKSSMIYFSLTTDNGKSWHTTDFSDLLEEEETFFLRDFYFIDDSVGFMVGGIKRDIGDTKKELIIKTTNGGYSWEVNRIHEYEYKDDGYQWNWHLQDIEFREDNPMYGIAVGQFGKVLTTSDGGESWHHDILTWFEGVGNDTVYQGAPNMTVTFSGRNAIVGAFAEGLWQGTFKPTGINDQKTNQNILTYPNPCGSYIYYEFPPALHSRKATLKVFDAAGNLVGTENLTIQPGRLKYIHEIKTSGTYFWQIEAGGEVFNGKFVKQ